MKILAMGKCVPQQVLDNEALSHMVDTNDEWIISRTGIRQRRIAQGETVVSMAAAAARQAMERAGTSPEEIGLVLVWKIKRDDIYKAVFEIDAPTTAGQTGVSASARMNILENFVGVQSDAALRQVAGC